MASNFLRELAEDEEAAPRKSVLQELAEEDDEPSSVPVAASEDIPWWKQELSASNLGRQTALAGRAVAQGVAALPLMAMDAGVATRNLVTGSDYEHPSAMWNRALDEYLPKPETLGEKVAGFAEGALAGSRLPMPQSGAQSPLASMPKPTDSPGAQILRDARAAGYVVPPTTAKPSTVNKLAESVAGKITTAQAASVKNQAVTNELVRKAIGLGSDAPITPAALKDLRATAGKVYEQIADFGDIAPDAKYIDDLSQLGKGAEEIAEAFPGANVGATKQIGEMVDSLMQDKFNSKAALQYLRELRKQSSGNLSGMNSADPAKQALGMAQREAAATLEDLIGRHLEASGMEDVARSFGQARRLIAMTHTVENALNESTGNVVAGKLGQQLAKGKPLSGGLDTVARFSRAFPKAAKEVTESMPGLSPLDWATGSIATAASGNLGAFAGVVLRPAIRAALLSKPWQASLTPTQAASGSMREAASMIISPNLPPSAAIQGGYLAQQE